MPARAGMAGHLEKLRFVATERNEGVLGSGAQVRAGADVAIGGRGVASARVALGPYRWPARIVFLGYLAASTILPFLALVAAASAMRVSSSGPTRVRACQAARSGGRRPSSCRTATESDRRRRAFLPSR